MLTNCLPNYEDYRDYYGLRVEDVLQEQY